MSEHFTGFWEDTTGDVRTTLGPVHVDVLLERLRARLLDLAPGVNVRIDLISWDETE